ncbi:MAG: spore germination protein [bacterium]
MNERVLDELRQRLKRIKMDGILESGYLEEMIEDRPFSPFPTMWFTERPDRSVASILEGRIALLTDGTPMALTVPSTFACFMQSPEDYYQRWPVTVGIRVFRYLGLFMTLLLPSIYVALTTYHQEMIPTSLAVAVAVQRERVPYPAVVEALAMQVVFEILMEAGIRLPRVMGQAISIVGALVIGQAAVTVGLISPAMVIVIAATAVASFTIPTFNMINAVRILRLPLIILAATAGLFGIFFGVLAILIHLTTLRSFGIPYLAGFAPLSLKDQQDIVFRAPWWAMQTRSKLYSTNRQRQGFDQKPIPPTDERSKNETEQQTKQPQR